MSGSKKDRGNLSPDSMRKLVQNIEDHIATFESHLAKVEGYQEENIDFGYQRQIDFSTWIEERRDKFEWGQNPSFNSIVFVKSIMDVLTEADKPLTDKAIKALCSNYCKDLGKFDYLIHPNFVASFWRSRLICME